MNAAAANAFAEDAREPPPGTYLILVSDEPRTNAGDAALALPQARGAAAWQRRCAGNGLPSQGVAAPDLALAQAAGAPLRALAIADPAVQDERRAATRRARRARAPVRDGTRRTDRRRWQGRAPCAARARAGMA